MDRIGEQWPDPETKFRDPEDTLATWSGVGLQPSWVKARLKEGYRLEDLRVEPSEAER